MRSAERSDACCGLYGERFTAASSVNAKDAVYIYMFADCIYATYRAGNACNVIKRSFPDTLCHCKPRNAASHMSHKPACMNTDDVHRQSVYDAGRVQLGAFAPSLPSKSAGSDTRDGKRIYAACPGSHASQKDKRPSQSQGQTMRLGQRF